VARFAYNKSERSGVVIGRFFVAIIAGLSLFACATAPEDTAISAGPTATGIASATADPGPLLKRASYQEDAPGFPFCNCKEKVGVVERALEAEKQKVRALETSLRVLRESVNYIEVTWTKKALYSLGQYDPETLEREGTRNTVGGTEYNEATIEAAKNFQCLYHPRGSDGNCDVAKTTGWLTFPESRSAICTAGYAGADDTAILLAQWYANGTVFERNLAYANWLVAKLQRNLPALIQEAEDESRRSYFLAIESDGRILESFINSMVNAEAEVRDLTPAQKAILKGDPNADLSLAEICPRAL